MRWSGCWVHSAVSASAAAPRPRGSWRAIVGPATGLSGAAARGWLSGMEGGRPAGRKRPTGLNEPAPKGRYYMPQTEWRLKGDWIKNCNCAFGCPCDFNARPTHGNCQGLVGMRVESGHFGSTKLDGLSFCVVVDFPGPLHEGN